jgi:anthranilate synthase component 1
MGFFLHPGNTMQGPFDIAADLDTPVSTFLKLGPLAPRFLLESVEGGLNLARYSFLGFGAAAELRLEDGVLRSRGADGAPLAAAGADLPGALRAALAGAPRLAPHIPGLPFAGGLVGVAGYDVVRQFERLPAPPRGAAVPAVPDAAYLAAESMLVFDHLTRRIALLHAGDEASREALRREVMQLLRGPLPAAPAGARHGPAVQSFSREEFCAAVGEAKRSIALGDVYQLVLSVRFAGEHTLSPFETYRALRLLNPSPYMFFLDLGDVQVVGSSPEALVRLRAGRAALRPIAGTRPRGADAEADLALEAGLRADAKENAEHVMLVDLARNDLGRVARAGSVHVDPYKAIERYSHVMHIVSGVQGELAPDRDAIDLFAAAFPAGTLVGAPKVRAMQLIDALEPVRRGLYAGTVGYFGSNGDMDQAITIRTLVFRDGTYSYQAGAGIVADSVPLAEYEEVLAKSAILRGALAMAEEGL